MRLNSQKKRKFKIEGYESFQKNKNIHSGGLCLSIAKSAGGQPFDVGKTENEIIMSCSSNNMYKSSDPINFSLWATGNASKDERDKFYDDLNIEVERAKLCEGQI